MMIRQLGAWKETSQGGRSKAREIQEPKRRACFKEDQAFHDVKLQEAAGAVHRIGSMEALGGRGKHSCQKTVGKKADWEVFQSEEWQSEEVERTSVDNPLETFYYGQELGGRWG